MENSLRLHESQRVTEFFAAVSQISVVVFLLASMSEIGLRLTLQQIVLPLRKIRLLGLAMLANFIIAPALALGIARLLQLEEPFAIGLLLLGLSAGAPFMPKIVEIAKGDVALAVGLLVIFMASTIIFLPIVLPQLVSGTQVNPAKIVILLVVMILLPLVAGLLIKARAALFAARMAPILERVSGIALLATIIAIFSLHFQSLLAMFGTPAAWAGLLFSVLTALIGWLLGGRDAAQRTALGLGTGFRSFPAALIVSVQNFPDPNVTVMVIVTTFIALVVLVPVALLMRKHQPAIPRPIEDPRSM